MTALTLSNLVAYSAQVMCLAGAAGLLVALFRIDAPGLRYGLLRLTLAVCLVLPWLQTPATGDTTTALSTVTVQSVEDDNPGARQSAAMTVDWTTWISVVLIAGIAIRLLWLAIGMQRLTRLRRAGDVVDAADHLALQQALGTAADVRYIAGFAQPVTFGVRKPVVLLPDSSRAQPLEIREAVLAHELVHVQRRDWAWVIAEETVRAVFWFHPAMWWLISRIQLAREEVVDELAVARTGRRRAYVEALMAFAEPASSRRARSTPLATAPAFARRRHLFRRMVLISREDVMTAKRLVVSSAVIVALMAVGGWYAVGAFPLMETAAGQILQKTPGPLESAAKPVTPENPIPRRLQHESPQYPAEAAAERAWVSVTLRVTIDASGSVAEARVTSARLRLANGVTSLTDERAKPAYDAAVAAAVAALERWRYEAPASPPISFDTTFFFSPELPVTDTPGAAPPPPPPPPPGGTSNRLQDDKAIRVGGNIQPPLKIKDVRPVYPLDAQAARIQGVVIAEIRIDETGRVSDAAILRSIPELDEAALAAIRQWEFQPILLNGAPTPVIMVATINFTLK